MDIDISKMLNAGVYDHPVSQPALIETHISWIILTGEFAYKIKKSVNYGFLDFSSLEKRHECCKQEVVLNRRLAAALYLEVVAITGTPEKPVISNREKGGSHRSEIFEYAVKMKQFPQSAQLDNRLSAGKLRVEHIDAIALMIADFHQSAKVANDAMTYGDKAALYQPVEKNFKLIREHLGAVTRDHSYQSTLNILHDWNRTEFDKQKTIFEQRKKNGFVRECHGDMHLRNLLWLDDKPMAFDCIEFNPDLRWIDVMSEIAFLIMDLQDRQQDQLAHRFLNTYLEATGDYAGLSVLPFYLCYRAMVRAKVDILRLEQETISSEEKQQTRVEFESYLKLAVRYTKRSTPKLIVMRGVSASGKSTVSQQLLNETEGIRIRSDVERKRLFNIPLTDHDSSEIEGGIYSAEASKKTYARLAELASTVIHAGHSVIVDAAFLKYEQRKLFQQLADQLAVSYHIVEVTAPVEILRQRIVKRKNDVSDADLGVLEHQLSSWQPLHKDEDHYAIVVNTAESTFITPSGWLLR